MHMRRGQVHVSIFPESEQNNNKNAFYKLRIQTKMEYHLLILNTKRHHHLFIVE
jgi:hypothetical protein